MSSSSARLIWVKVVVAGTESVTSVRCYPTETTIDDLKKLVKTEFSSKLDCIDAPDLVVKGADGEKIKEDVFLETRRPEGNSVDEAFLVQAPPSG